MPQKQSKKVWKPHAAIWSCRLSWYRSRQNEPQEIQSTGISLAPQMWLDGQNRRRWHCKSFLRWWNVQKHPHTVRLFFPKAKAGSDWNKPKWTWIGCRTVSDIWPPPGTWHGWYVRKCILDFGMMLSHLKLNRWDVKHLTLLYSFAGVFRRETLHFSQLLTGCFTTLSGFFENCSVWPGCPFCPPLFLPFRLRRLLGEGFW